MPRTKRRSKQAELKRREEAFDLGCFREKLPSYNALHDHNLRHFFENRRIQGHLYNSGLIDKAGRVVDLDKNRAKLVIIEQEFSLAEKAETWRQREEEEMRRRVQLKRFEALERARREERLFKIQEDKLIRQEIVRATAEANGGLPPPVRRRSTTSRPRRRKKRSASSRSRAGGGPGSAFAPESSAGSGFGYGDGSEDALGLVEQR